MDWTGCELVEQVPGKVSGQPIVVGTRILVETIVDDFESGSPIEEIQENFPALSVECIKRLIAFAHARQGELIR